MPLLAAQEAITSLNLASADGRSVLFLRIAGIWSMRELLEAGPSARIRWSRLDAAGHIQETEPWTGMSYDPRTRPWYKLSASATSPTWTEPYVFYTTQDPGITYTLPVRTQQKLIGVVALDFLLDDLTARVWRAQPTPRSQCAVVDGQRRVLILPNTASYQSLSARREAFMKPVGSGLLDTQAGLLDASRTDSTVRSFRYEGDTLVGLNIPFEGPPGIHWRLLLTVPEDDLLGSAWLRLWSLTVLALLSIGLATWRIRIIAKRVVDPISALSASAEALGKGEPIHPVISNIQEIRNLDLALQRASASLNTEDQLQRQLEHSQRMETVGTLAGGIAHDVNNQLAAILGQLNLCRELLPEAHALQGRLEKAEEATLRCAQTTKALLSFSHKSKPELKWLDLNELVQETANILERLLGGRIRLNLQLAPGLPAIPGDPVQLEQVLMNLSINARDAMPEGGTLSLCTHETADGRVCLEIQDSGTGIPEAILPHIFEPFVTTKEVGKGTGLGLAMVFAILKAHRGTITAENSPNEGARFRITLPISHSPSDPFLAKQAKAQPHPEILAGKRVLLAEDEILLRDMLADALTLARVQVTTAPDGAVAWKAWQAAPFDLVVSDHRMPDCTGMELLNLIRSTGSQVPFLMISGQGLEAMEDTLARDPRLRLLPKPFEIPRLLLAMEEALQRV
jgi:signal transduction histidine kinase